MGKSEAARTFGVSLSSVKRYVGKARQQGNSLSLRGNTRGRAPKLNERARRLLEADVEKRPAVTLRQRCRFVEGVAGVVRERVDALAALEADGIQPKRRTVGASERDEFLKELLGERSWPAQVGGEALRVRGYEMGANTSLSPI